MSEILFRETITYTLFFLKLIIQTVKNHQNYSTIISILLVITNNLQALKMIRQQLSRSWAGNY